MTSLKDQIPDEEEYSEYLLKNIKTVKKSTKTVKNETLNESTENPSASKKEIKKLITKTVEVALNKIGRLPRGEKAAITRAANKAGMSVSQFRKEARAIIKK